MLLNMGQSLPESHYLIHLLLCPLFWVCKVGIFFSGVARPKLCWLTELMDGVLQPLPHYSLLVWARVTATTGISAG